MSSKPSRSWEAWQLTAFVLGELDPEQAQRIAAAAVGDSALARELTELSRTLDDLRAVYQHEATASEAVGASAHESIANLQLPDLQAAVASTGVDRNLNRSESASSAFERLSQSRRGSWQRWSALAAILLVGATIWIGPAVRSLWHNTDLAHNIAPSIPNATAPQELPSAWVDVESKESLTPLQRDSSTRPINPINDLDPADDFVALPQQTGELLSIDELASTVQEAKGRTDGLHSVELKSSVASGSSMSGAGAGGYGMSAGASGYGMSVAGGGGLGGMAGASGGPTQNARPLDSRSSPSGISQPTSQFGTNAPARENLAISDDESLRKDQSNSASEASLLAYGNSGLETKLSDQYVETDGAQSKYGRKSENSASERERTLLYERARFGVDVEGPRVSGDRFEAVSETPFAQVSASPLSTFSIDVDTASFTKARQYLLEHQQVPPPNAVRIEEFINYFDYEYQGPTDESPFGAALAVAECPWQTDHRLVRIALQAKKVDLSDRPKANLVFLLDVSGSMDEPNKLPLVKETMRMLTRQLGENDRVAMIVYAGAAGCVLESTRGNHQKEILSAIERLQAGGSTNGGQGIELAYSTARDHFIPGGINRVILCTDGDFNVGVTSTDQLVDLVAENAKSKIFLTVLGYGIGNTNDAMLEQISNRGNGVYGFVDSRREAHRQMVKQLAGNLMTVAKDVKIQVEFNPATVSAYRLIGYENRRLAAEDFNNDKKDAGEIGAGHRVTALYEIVPVRTGQSDERGVDPLRYQPTEVKASNSVKADEKNRELLAVKLRYKQPEGDESQLLTFPLKDSSVAFSDADRDFRWAAAVAEFGMLLRGSQHKGTATWTDLIERANTAAGVEPDAARTECLEMIRVAAQHKQGHLYKPYPRE